MERSYLQEKELAIAEAHGLNRKQIRIMSKKNLDYVQMGILRTALEQGIPEEQVKKAAKAKYTPEQMLEILGKKPEEKKKRKELPEWSGWILPGLSVPLTAAILLGLGFSMKPDKLVLKSDHITLHTGDVFQPAQYILSYPEHSDVILPESFTAEQPGGRIAVYRSTEGMQKVLRIQVEDHRAPQIRIDESRADPGDCMQALISAYDAEDGDLGRDMECTVSGSSIVYSVSDHSGNTASVTADIMEESVPEES